VAWSCALVPIPPKHPTNSQCLDHLGLCMECLASTGATSSWRTTSRTRKGTRSTHSPFGIIVCIWHLAKFSLWILVSKNSLSMYSKYKLRESLLITYQISILTSNCYPLPSRRQRWFLILRYRAWSQLLPWRLLFSWSHVGSGIHWC